MKVLRNPQFLFGLLISCGLVGYLIAATDWAAVSGELAVLNWWVLIPGVLLVIVQQLFRGWRWRYLLPVSSKRSPTDAELFDAISIGNLATNIFPLRAGEFLRPYVLTSRGLYPFGVSFVSIVIERVFDLSAVLLTFALVFPVMEGFEVLTVAVRSFTFISIGMLSGLLLAAFSPKPFEYLVSFFSRFIPSQKIAAAVTKLSRDVLVGTQVLKSPSRLFMTLALSLVIWLITYGQFYMFLALFSTPAEFQTAVITCVCVALAVALPAAPGFIGVFQLGCVLGLQKLSGYSQPQAITYSIVMHVTGFLVVIACGWLALVRTKINLSRLKDEAATIPSA